jgi:propionate CoA-transferase
MLRPTFLTVLDAVKLIKDGDTICNISMTLIGGSEAVYKEIERDFLATGHPRDLTIFHPCGFSDRHIGMEHFAHEGLIRRLVGSHWGLAPKIMQLIAQNKVEAYCMPLGVLMNMFHAMCATQPGTVSKIGLGTYLDPRVEGGKMNGISKDDMVELITIHGEEYLLYKHTPIDVTLLRGSYADEDGNITMIDEALKMENLNAALATKRYGGKVIVQVKGILKSGSIPPKEVEIPGIFVDAVVVCEDPQKDHRQTSSWYQDDTYSGRFRAPEFSAAPIPMSERKAIVRRALMEVHPDITMNIGTGIPTDAMGPILSEEGVSDLVTLTVESGVYGGVPAGGGDFGISRNPAALIPENIQFDFYDGPGVDFTFMGGGEMDELGNVNVTKMGHIAPGCGGFINITTRARNVIFCSTFSGKGLRVSCSPELGLTILQEGAIRKLVKRVTQISYNAKIAIEKGQTAFFVTERAVFRLTSEGPVLVEIAKGIDLQKDVLDLMGFTPKIQEPLGVINPVIYRDGPFGLRDMMLHKIQRV